MSDLDGARGPAGGWWRGWTPWITALVLAALFAGATSGITFVRRSYEPPVDYPAMNESEPEERSVSSSPTAPARKKDRRASSPSVRPTGAAGEPRPEEAPRKVEPSLSGSGGTERLESEEPPESSAHPFVGLGELLGMGGED